MNQQKIGAFMRELRLDKGLTQEQLAERLGVSNRSVSRWENGNNLPDLSLLLELAKLYGVGVDEILDGKRKETHTDEQTAEAIEKVADYANEEKARFKKTLRGLLILSLIMSFATVFIGVFELEGRLPSFLIGFSNGVNLGIFILLLVLLSAAGTKLRAAKLKLLNKIKGKGDSK